MSSFAATRVHARVAGVSPRASSARGLPRAGFRAPGSCGKLRARARLPLHATPRRDATVAGRGGHAVRAVADAKPPSPVKPVEHKPHEHDLPGLSPTSREDRVDLLIVGCGPAGLSAADRASEKGLRVALVDPRPLAAWRNNYGVWVDEFQELGLDDCFANVWPKARVVIDDERPEGIQLDRPYAQVDRVKLKDKLLARCVERGVQFGACAVEDVRHERDGSIVTLKGGDPNSPNALSGVEVHAKMVLDATGHVRKIVEFERDFTPGYQAAFGIVCETVEPHGFPLDEMLFMDWRDAHLDSKFKAMNDEHPTFLYAMPFGPNKIFLEETSLVERPGLEFDDLKVKLQQRLDRLGVEVKSVEEEEYCLIPMGGVLPTLPQRALGVGGTAGMVHPSTGFMVAKTLLSVRSLVDTLADEIAAGQSDESIDADAVSAKVWRSVWPDDELRMRTFMCFGMETLMQLNIKGTRQFFETFFQMSEEIWGGFLSWRVKPAGLVKLGGVLFLKFSNYMRFNFVWSALPFMLSFVKNFADAGNTFDSQKWGGMALRKNEKPPVVPGQGPIPKPNAKGSLRGAANPCDEPITSSPLDFTALVGGDVDTPRAASQLRPDKEWIEFQQRKVFQDQAPLAETLAPLNGGDEVDVVVVGAGPAGLAVAAEMAQRGVSVGLVAPDTPFVNNYGVWLDEFDELGLRDCLLHEYDDALVWFNDEDPAEGIGLGRPYGQVCRRRLREELLKRCERHGVRYMPGLVDQVTHSENDEPSTLRGSLARFDDAEMDASTALDAEFELKARLVVCSTGHNRDMLRYGEGPPPGWQTAYGVEVRMPDHPFEVNKAVFMDFRQSDPELEGDAPGAEGVWRVPSFLYVLPVDKDTVFVEETCLVSRVQVPFDELKRRLYRRLKRMGLPVEKENIIEEEASWIPLGGTPPVAPQRTLAYGAAAGLVHPASGYSIVNSLRRAPSFAEAVVRGLNAGGSVEASRAGWEVLWGDEPRRQVGFYQFGMELLMSLRIEQMRNFFSTFFGLPKDLSAGFLGNDLSSSKLIVFALTCFIQGNWELRALLLTHLASAGAGVRLGQAYLYPALRAMEAAKQKDASRVPAEALARKAPPQEPNFSSFAKDLGAAEKQGMMPGFQGKDWWAVGSMDSGGNGSASAGDDEPSSGKARDDDDDAGGGGGGSATPAAAIGGPSDGSVSVAREPETSMAYWSDGSAALVVTSAVRRTGLTSSSLYGESRRKFMPAALLNLAGPKAVPAYLTGEMPGDAGWDPLQMGAQRDIMKLRERELIHGRWAMLAAVGVLTPECTAKLSLFGTPGQHWWNTSLVFDGANGIWPSLTYLGETIPNEIVWLPILHLPLFVIAESLRTGTYTLERFAHLDRMYPGGKLFDPLGIGANVSDEDLAVLKTIEIQHCRLAMIASFGFIVEALGWGAGPLDFLP